MLLPTLVERIADGDRDAFDRTLLDTARYAALALLLVAAAAGGAAEGVMHIFGPGFEAGSDALAILLVTPALTVVVGVEAQAQYALNRPWASTTTAVIGMVAKVIGVIVLTETSGLTGAAAGFAAGTLLQFRIQSPPTSHATSTGPPAAGCCSRQLIGILVAYAAGFAAALGCSTRRWPSRSGSLAGLAAGSAAFLAAHLWVARSPRARPAADRDRAPPAAQAQPADARARRAGRRAHACRAPDRASASSAAGEPRRATR